MSKVTVEVASKRLEEFLRRQGLRFTRERREILAEIFSRREHFEAADLLRRLKKTNPRVSRATLYRTLNLLVSAGLLRQVSLGERFSRFEQSIGRAHHDHLLCLGCGAVIEFSSQRLETLQEQICTSKGFQAVGHTLQISGYCRKCLRKRK